MFIRFSYFALKIIFMSALFCSSVSLARSGCCSYHGGVNHCESSSGRIVCNDGTYSPSCMCEPDSKNPKFQPGSQPYSFLSDNEIKNLLILQSIKKYLNTKGNCPCPYNEDADGYYCGDRSAWSRPGGEKPLCYHSDITNKMIIQYRVWSE